MLKSKFNQFILDDDFDGYKEALTSIENLSDRYKVFEYTLKLLGIMPNEIGSEWVPLIKSFPSKQVTQWAKKIFDNLIDIFCLKDWDYLDDLDKIYRRCYIEKTLNNFMFYLRVYKVEELFLSSKSIENLLSCIPKEETSINLGILVLCIVLTYKRKLEGSIDAKFLLPMIDFLETGKNYETMGFVILDAYKNLKINGEIEISILTNIMQNFISANNELDKKLVDELSLPSVIQQNIAKNVMNNNFMSPEELQESYKKELAKELGIELTELQEVTMDDKFDFEKFSLLFANTALNLNNYFKAIVCQNDQSDQIEEELENHFMPLALRREFFDKIKTELNNTMELDNSWALVETSKLKEITNDEKNDSESAIYKKGDSIEFYKLTDKDYEIFMDGKNSDLQHQIIDNLIQEYHALNVKSNFYCG